MSLAILQSGQHQAVDTEAGPGAYSQDGYEIRASVGRADAAVASIDNETYEARATVSDSNLVTVNVYNIADGTEVAADTDLSGDTITVQSYRL